MQMFVYSAVTAGNLQTLLQSLRRLSAPESVSDSLERPWALQVTTDHHLMGALRTVNFISISFFVRANACIWRRVMQPPWTISDDDEEEASPAAADVQLHPGPELARRRQVQCSSCCRRSRREGYLTLSPVQAGFLPQWCRESTEREGSRLKILVLVFKAWLRWTETNTIRKIPMKCHIFCCRS